MRVARSGRVGPKADERGERACPRSFHQGCNSVDIGTIVSAIVRHAVASHFERRDRIV